ncbi:MAG TPA: hypothetical protein PKO22_12195 [Treponemataceae bacterium]|nr:hypothetical protein [Treponemataceae bacterium]
MKRIIFVVAFALCLADGLFAQDDAASRSGEWASDLDSLFAEFDATLRESGFSIADFVELVAADARTYADHQALRRQIQSRLVSYASTAAESGTPPVRRKTSDSIRPRGGEPLISISDAPPGITVSLFFPPTEDRVTMEWNP